MAPKKDKKNRAEDQVQVKGFTEVEKTFLEQQIADCNRKIARLRTAVDEYEQRNEELQKAYEKLDEDRADIIAYLKKTLTVKSEENVELKDKVKGLEETREIETAQFKHTVNELERNFTVMKDQLTSENKLLAGKLNTLEEFRAIRDDLMRKYEKQEEAFQEQEMKYKRIVYEAEKKFVIGKDKLKKEMEARLLQLAQDFQDATELRIAASTHRVIRENIAINNELDNILAMQAKLSDQNEKFKESERLAKIAQELAEEERDKAINKNVVQLKVIDQLTNAFQEIKKQKAIYQKKTFDFETLESKIQRLSKENENLSLQVRILEQNLHARISDQNKAKIQTTKVIKEGAKLKKILKEAAVAVQAALKLEEWAVSDPTRELMDRQVLLSRLLDILTQYKEVQRAESIETVASLGKVYEEGDLGFVPKSTISKKRSLTSAVVTSAISIETTKVSDKGDTSVSVSASTVGSMKTIPSMQIIPATSQEALQQQDSLPSFMTSTKSSVTEEAVGEGEENEEDETNIEKMLEKSKLEMQKSFMKDLAVSQLQLRRSMETEAVRASMADIVAEAKTEAERAKLEAAGGEESKTEEAKEDEKPTEEKTADEAAAESQPATPAEDDEKKKTEKSE